MRGVYFNDNDLSLFLFYKSNFSEARFYSCRWTVKKPKREKIICDELLLDYKKKPKLDNDKEKYKKDYVIEDLDSYREIASMYREFKTIHDIKKDYTESGWFYFNELEMKKKALKDDIKIKEWKHLFRNIGYYILYTFYKYFMGYGERPLRSVFSFLLFTIIFSGIHMLSGLNAVGYKIINYDISLNLHDVLNISNIPLKDFYYALIFSLCRVIPNNYIPSNVFQITPIGSDGLFWSIMNSIVLILFAVFIGIGLKRHFRRF